MIEGKRVVAGEAILTGLGATDRSKIDLTQTARSRTESQVQSRVETNDELLEALVREHSRLVFRIAYAVLRRHHDAEDATQETFMRVLRYRAKLAEVDQPKTWLARIAWRVAIDRSQQLGRTHEIPLDDHGKPMEMATSETSADESFRGEQFGAVLEKLIAALPQKLREPLILSAIEEMSPRDIASTLAVSEAAVRSRVFRARQILKEKLAQQAGRK